LPFAIWRGRTNISSTFATQTSLFVCRELLHEPCGHRLFALFIRSIGKWVYLFVFFTGHHLWDSLRDNDCSRKRKNRFASRRTPSGLASDLQKRRRQISEGQSHTSILLSAIYLLCLIVPHQVIGDFVITPYLKSGCMSVAYL